MGNNKHVYANITVANEAYKKYIYEHQVNVLRAYNMYGQQIIDILGLTIEEEDILHDNLHCHDESKYQDEEFYAYRNKFYPFVESDTSSIETGFKYAWMHHYQYNPHHPEHWIYLNTDKPEIKIEILNMPDIYIAEMICDWIAMGYKFNSRAYNWYYMNKDHIPLSKDTRFKVESILKEIKKYDESRHH